jgi:phasin family protein
MLNSPEQFTASARAQMESQLHMATSLTDTMIDSVEKVIGLNLQAAKASLDNSVGNVQQLLSLKDPQEFLNVSTAQSQPQVDIALTYARHLASIATATHVELTKVAETQVTESSRHWISLLDSFSKAAPAGSDTAISMMKSAIDNVSSGYAQLNRSAKVAIEAMEHQMSAASSQLSQFAPRAASRAKK